MLTIKDIIEKCIDVDVQNEIMTGDEAMNYYLNISIKKLMKIYNDYYGKTKKEN